MLSCVAKREGRPTPNVKRVYRVMKVHGLLLQRHAGGEERRHEGRIAVDARNTRWCSDGLEIGCDNGERVRVAFALDCCDREAMSFVATTSGITGEDVRDLMVAAVEHRFGPVNRLPVEIEWLTDNGSCYLARETRRFGRDVGLVPCTTPLESPQSNGMAEAFVRTLKRDYVRVSPVPDAETVLRQLPSWPLQVGCWRGRLWMQQSIRPVAGAITSLAMMRIRFSLPHKVHGLKGHVVVQAEERRSVPTCHHPPRIASARWGADLLSRAQAVA